MKNLTVMVGLPGSGKTTWAYQNRVKGDAICFSSDDYREKLTGDPSNQEKNDLVFRTIYKQMETAMQQGINIVFDATNLTAKSRRKVLELSVKYEYEAEACIMCTPLEECEKRNARRPRQVPREIIRAKAMGFQPPHFCEGWRSIVLKYPDTSSTIFDSEMQKEYLHCMEFFNQKNPHHKFSLLEHATRLAENYPVESWKFEAGLWHDVGKMFTQTFDDKGVAHYRGHDGLGAYWILTHPQVLLPSNNISHVLDIVFFIAWHMKAHRDMRGSEKAEKKYRSWFGWNKEGEKDMYDQLMEFAEFDKRASGTYEEHNEIVASLVENKD